ncbi:hypothetical protein, partial [Rhizobium sp. L245/93]|uniref:hypothetical protein n=1 Tax=Rhizobium sp. L245/93 TaxID=2819998 RepID=UPI001ADAF431
SQPLDQTLIRKPYSEVAHFSVEKPAQFRVKTNKRYLESDLEDVFENCTCFDCHPYNHGRAGKCATIRTPYRAICQ